MSLITPVEEQAKKAMEVNARSNEEKINQGQAQCSPSLQC